MELTEKDFTKGGFGCLEGTPLIAVRMDANFDQVKEDIIRALKLQTEIKRRFIEARDVYNEEHTSPDHKEHAMQIATTFQGVLDHIGVEYD